MIMQDFKEIINRIIAEYVRIKDNGRKRYFVADGLNSYDLDYDT